MPFAERFRRQVRLLIRTLPALAAEDCFAMKGGTAINLFVRDMPRLSVDIDLTYLPVESREASLAGIEGALVRVRGRILRGLAGTRVQASATREEAINKLVVRQGDAQVKIEVTPVLRGCVFDPEVCSVTAVVEEAFGFGEMRVVSFEDLYAGKIVAALDRQHPRDLFDVRDLLAHEGVDMRLRQAFLVYLISHNRPMVEVLAPQRKDIAEVFEQGFVGMTAVPVTLDSLLDAREALIGEVVGKMPDEHREFLVSFEVGEPEWDLLGIDVAPDLPAVRWRRQNLDELNTEARARLVRSLAGVLGVSV